MASKNWPNNSFRAVPRLGLVQAMGATQPRKGDFLKAALFVVLLVAVADPGYAAAADTPNNRSDVFASTLRGSA